MFRRIERGGLQPGGPERDSDSAIASSLPPPAARRDSRGGGGPLTHPSVQKTRGEGRGGDGEICQNSSLGIGGGR